MEIIFDENGRLLKPYFVECKDCKYFKPYPEIEGYGDCQSSHTQDHYAFKETDFCSNGKRAE